MIKTPRGRKIHTKSVFKGVNSILNTEFRSKFFKERSLQYPLIDRAVETLSPLGKQLRRMECYSNEFFLFSFPLSLSRGLFVQAFDKAIV